MRVLIITSRFPLPAWRGNQVRTVEWLEALADCERSIVCPEPPDPVIVRGLEPIAESICCYRSGRLQQVLGLSTAVMRGYPAQEGLYATAGARRSVADVAREQSPDVAVVQMVRCGWAADIITSRAPQAALVFDAIDSMGLHYQRRARSARSPLKLLLWAEAARCRRRERDLARHADLATAVSERDLAALSAADDRGAVVPVSGRPLPASRPDPDRPTVLLSGNLGYRPTVEAAIWFSRHVWPQLECLVPGVRWLLVGARPARSIRRLAVLPNVEVHGDVPDVSRFLTQASVAIAPMATGSGIPMKVLEAWSASVPVVADPWTADGLGRVAAEVVAVADSDDEWLTTLRRLLMDREAARGLGERGHREWSRRFQRQRVFESIRESASRAVAHRRRSPR